MNKAEQMFCEYFAATLDKTASARKAGFCTDPEREAVRLLSKPAVKKRCKKLIKNSLECHTVASALVKIAFGNTNVTKLQEDGPNLEDIDMFCVSEIKRGANGSLELKFFDKLKALQLLADIRPESDENKMQGFYEAIVKGASALNQDRNEEE